ncbi:PEP-CTERM sorting domain-containing protein [Roseiconus lacunae]|uniref:PEP-CTERM sorting domain-containing protein n=1 Tax=Roseiconus lacunae TaxID=2605694 RepID=A0ABT7PR94_9BACT|nr:PEP-CTERM sorting domain-containing protein [Roseiconus lacunae]MDM4019045.1 PEP-CTERM sorting domain-containing protein [Roseiconus lacunae]
MCRYIPIVCCVILFGVNIDVGSHSLSAAETFTLQLRADGDSRWFDFRAHTFAELSAPAYEQRDGTTGELIEDWAPRRDGMYSLADEGVASHPAGDPQAGQTDLSQFDSATFSPSAYAEQTGRYDEETGDVFLAGDDGSETTFSNSYSVEYDDSSLIGSGMEVAGILGFQLDFVNDVADDDPIFGYISDPYVSTASNAWGSVTLLDGQVMSIDGGADVNFNYNVFGLADELNYDGTIAFSGDQWNLNVVDEDDLNGFGLYGLGWDVHGNVSNVSAVPEPSSLAFLMGLASSVMFRRRRRRFVSFID